MKPQPSRTYRHCSSDIQVDFGLSKVNVIVLHNGMLRPGKGSAGTAAGSGGSEASEASEEYPWAFRPFQTCGLVIGRPGVNDGLTKEG